jgi:hypothetical protein
VSEVIRVLAVVAIIGYVIGRQLMGEPLRGKRVVLLPVILAVAGVVDLGKHGRHVEPADVVFLVISGLIAVTIGLLQGRMMRLEARNGALWGQMPVRALWLWALLVGSRLIMTVIALAVGAKVAGSSAPIIMLLGINRLGQAAIVMRHALATGIPFAPEKDGTSFLSGQLGGAASRPPGPASPTRRSAGPVTRGQTGRLRLARTARRRRRRRRIRSGIPIGYCRQPVTQTRPATPGQVQPTMFRTAAARRLTWRCWPAWPVSGWQHGVSGDGSP